MTVSKGIAAVASGLSKGTAVRLPGSPLEQNTKIYAKRNGDVMCPNKGPDEIDWGKIRDEYDRGGTTYRILARKYRVPYVQLASRAKKEGWALRRAGRKPHYSVGDVADELSRLLVDWMNGLQEPAVSDIDKAAGALKKIQDIRRAGEEKQEEGDGTIILEHHIPRGGEGEATASPMRHVSDGDKPDGTAILPAAPGPYSGKPDGRLLCGEEDRNEADA